jgi:hypothetical protein
MQHYNAVSSTCVDTEMKMLGIVYLATVKTPDILVDNDSIQVP